MEIPFDSERKRMTTIHQAPSASVELPQGLSILHTQRQGDWIAFTKGAVDGSAAVSDQVWVNDHIEPLTREWVERIHEANNGMAQKGVSASWA